LGTQDTDNPKKLATLGTQDTDNPKKLATLGTQDKDNQGKQNKNSSQYVLDTTIPKQTEKT
jgi:hypothetical protein